MPFSSQAGKSYIRDLALSGETILDIGSGSGTYRKLFPQLGKHWTAIEVWEPYVHQYGLLSLYDEVFVEDVRTWMPPRNYDICFVGDILEHMTASEAGAVLQKLRAVCKTVIVSIPIGHYPQDEYDGNPYERHIVDNWTHEAFVDCFGVPSKHIIDGEIGVYVYQRLKIAVNAISKNEASFVERFCQSAQDADLILIADTGSTDETVEIARKQPKTVVHDICITPWRFDLARNAAIALLPRDIDIVISLDLDEILEPGWREEIERVWELGKTTRLRYKFDWGCGISFYYEKIFARHGYRFHHPVHEYPRPDGRITEVYAHTDNLLVSHHPDPTKSRGQYLDLLRLAVKEDPRCPRNAFYFARELTFYCLWDEAIGALTSYLNMPESNWANERCYAMRLLGKSYDELGNNELAMKWYRAACSEAPNTREPWCDLAMACYRRSMWPECYMAATNALEIKNRELVYTCDPAVWGPLPHDMAAISAFRLGMNKKAIEHGTEAVKLSPDDQRLISNLAWYSQEVEQQIED